MASTTRIGYDTPDRNHASQAGYPEGSTRFDWTMLGLSALFVVGLWIDGWAHFHGRTDNSFFTPWHALFYSAFGIVALFLSAHQLRNVRRGYAFTRALPQGYALSLTGVGVFALGGVGDMVWHTLFGIEGGSEALTSPSHIMLGLGMALVITGTVRAAWSRWQGRDDARGWGKLGAMIIGVILLLTLILFFISYSSPIVNPYGIFEMYRMSNSMLQDFGVSGILLSAAIMSGTIALMAWRWHLPFGTFTLMFGLSTALLTVLNDAFVLILPAVIAGVIVDAAYVILQPSPARSVRYLTFTFLAPFAFFGLYVTALVLIGTRWSIHVWSGAAFLSGVIGLLAGMMIQASKEKK